MPLKTSQNSNQTVKVLAQKDKIIKIKDIRNKQGKLGKMLMSEENSLAELRKEALS